MWFTVSSEVKKKLEEIEELIRQAQGGRAQGLLLELLKGTIPPSYLLRTASIATRANLPLLSLKLLHPIIRPTSKILRPATDQDKAEYSFALLRIGACTEARNLLGEIKATDVPEALLYRAMLLLKEWDYSAAVPVLRNYTAAPTLSDYQKLVGKVNLAISLIFENSLSEVKVLLSEVLEEASQRKLNLLYGKAICLLGNLEMRRKNWDAAFGSFQQGEHILQEFAGLDLYFARKWKALVQYFLTPESKDARLAVTQMREEAARWQHWESMRDIDYHMAAFNQDKALLIHLYFGTPLPHFQMRILTELKTAEIPNEYDWVLMEKAGSKKTAVDVAEQQKTELGHFLKVGHSVHRLYCALLSDFYRPFSVAMLLEHVFPNEHYRPDVSEFRVHNAIRRLRTWLKENHLPITVAEENGAYKIKAIKPCYIPIRRRVQEAAPLDGRLSLVRDRLRDKAFTRKEVEELLDLKRASTTQLLQNAVNDGILEKEGKGMHTKYRFTDLKNLKKAA